MSAPSSSPGSGVAVFADMAGACAETDLRFVPIPGFATLTERERARLAEALKPFDEARRRARRRRIQAVYL